MAHNIQPIDMVCLDYKNQEVVARETAEGRIMGFTGKQAIHPNQIEAIYQGFVPSDNEIDFARKILEQDALQQAAGKGAYSVDGKMIDKPLYLWALGIQKRILQQ